MGTHVAMGYIMCCYGVLHVLLWHNMWYIMRCYGVHHVLLWGAASCVAVVYGGASYVAIGCTCVRQVFAYQSISNAYLLQLSQSRGIGHHN